MAAMARAASSSMIARRTISQPAAANRSIWAQVASRITSYNVCYTKLLRFSEPHARRGLQYRPGKDRLRRQESKEDPKEDTGSYNFV